MRAAVQPSDWCYGTPDEMDQRAWEYARSYAGSGRFMRQMQQRVWDGRPFTEVMVDRILMSKAAAEKGFNPPRHKRVGRTRKQQFERRTVKHFTAQEAMWAGPDIRVLPFGTHHYAAVTTAGLSAVKTERPARGKWMGYVFVHHLLGPGLDKGGMQLPGDQETYRGPFPSVMLAIVLNLRAAEMAYDQYFGKKPVDKSVSMG